jgi:hypothetical protein
MTPCNLNRWITDWVQNLSRLGLFLNNFCWYKVTGLPVFLFFEVALTQNYHYAASILFLVCCISNPTVPFVPMLVLYVQHQRTESAQNGSVRTTLSRQFK